MSRIELDDGSGVWVQRERADATPAPDPLAEIANAIGEVADRDEDEATTFVEYADAILAALGAAGLQVVPAAEIAQLRLEHANLSAGLEDFLRHDLERLRGVTADRYEPAMRGSVQIIGPLGELLYRRVSP